MRYFSIFLHSILLIILSLDWQNEHTQDKLLEEALSISLRKIDLMLKEPLQFFNSIDQTEEKIFLYLRENISTSSESDFSEWKAFSYTSEGLLIGEYLLENKEGRFHYTLDLSPLQKKIDEISLKLKGTLSFHQGSLSLFSHRSPLHTSYFPLKEYKQVLERSQWTSVLSKQNIITTQKMRLKKSLILLRALSISTLFLHLLLFFLNKKTRQETKEGYFFLLFFVFFLYLDPRSSYTTQRELISQSEIAIATLASEALSFKEMLIHSFKVKKDLYVSAENPSFFKEWSFPLSHQIADIHIEIEKKAFPRLDAFPEEGYLTYTGEDIEPFLTLIYPKKRVLLSQLILEFFIFSSFYLFYLIAKKTSLSAHLSGISFGESLRAFFFSLCLLVLL